MSTVELLKQFIKDKVELDRNAEMFFSSIMEIIRIKLGNNISSYFSYYFESNSDGEYVVEVKVANNISRFGTINFVFNKVIIYSTIITTNYVKNVNYDNAFVDDLIDILGYKKLIIIKCELRKKNV